MPCDTRLAANQTISQRKEEVYSTVVNTQRLILAGVVKVKISKEGAIAFDGLTDADRNRVTDACIYRRLMSIGNNLVKAKIAQAEAMAGKTVNRQVIGQGMHSHDGGRTWHNGH